MARTRRRKKKTHMSDKLLCQWVFCSLSHMRKRRNKKKTNSGYGCGDAGNTAAFAPATTPSDHASTKTDKLKLKF